MQAWCISRTPQADNYGLRRQYPNNVQLFCPAGVFFCIGPEQGVPFSLNCWRASSRPIQKKQSRRVVLWDWRRSKWDTVTQAASIKGHSSQSCNTCDMSTKGKSTVVLASVLFLCIGQERAYSCMKLPAGIVPPNTKETILQTAGIKDTQHLLYRTKKSCF